MSDTIQARSGDNKGPTVERKAYTIAEYCEAYRVKAHLLYALSRRGEGPPKMKIGSRTFIRVEDAAKWFRSLRVI